MNVMDLPLLDLEVELPEGYSLRGNKEFTALVYDKDGYIAHCIVSGEEFELPPMLNNLRGNVFEHKYPGMLSQFINDEAEAVSAMPRFLSKYSAVKQDLIAAGIRWNYN